MSRIGHYTVLLSFFFVASCTGHTTDSDSAPAPDVDFDCSPNAIIDSLAPPSDPPPTVTTLDSLSGGFKIEGDLRLKYKQESTRDGDQRIIGTGTPFENKAFRDEFNLYIYYEGKETIGSARLKFDNKMGTLGGTTDKISLPKAYFARQLFRFGPTYMRLGLGRRPMNEIFESDVQFNSRIDGGFVRFGSIVPSVCDFNIDVLGTIVDPHYNYYAWGVEFEFNNIRSYGIYLKYAFMSWLKQGASAVMDGDGNRSSFNGGEVDDNPQNQYQTSQIIVGYILEPTRFEIPLRCYAAFLINHKAQKQAFLNNEKENTAWYLGFQLGSSRKPGGFSIDYSYQFVRAQAVQELDMAGIGTGNPRNNSLYGPLVSDFTGVALPLTAANANGNTNYRGWELKGLYRYTDHISWRLIYKTSSPANKAIGPDRRYHKCESQWIYNF